MLQRPRGLSAAVVVASALFVLAGAVASAAPDPNTHGQYNGAGHWNNGTSSNHRHHHHHHRVAPNNPPGHHPKPPRHHHGNDH